MYMLVKHLHLTLISISLALFILRFYWRLKDAPHLQRKWVRVLPHVVDTLLLVSAATLCVLIAQYPFVDLWVTEKLFAVLLYILMGLVALKLGRTTAMRWVGFIGAISWLAFAAKVAVLKQPLLFA